MVADAGPCPRFLSCRGRPDVSQEVSSTRNQHRFVSVSHEDYLVVPIQYVERQPSAWTCNSPESGPMRSMAMTPIMS